jgi:DNA-binding transcriptional ArsR family regulator
MVVTVDDDDDVVFRALADRTRRHLLDVLFENDGRTLGELEACIPDMTRFGVMRHLTVLENAGLVVTCKQGRHKYHYLNAVPIGVMSRRWLNKYSDKMTDALLDLKDEIEGEP